MWFGFEEYLENSGDKEPPLKCQYLTFDVNENEIVSGGSIEICETKPIRVRLYGYVENDFSKVIYDSAISKEYNLDGFWDEVTD